MTYIVAKVQTTVLYFKIEATSRFSAEEMAKEGGSIYMGETRTGVPQYFCVPHLPVKETP